MLEVENFRYLLEEHLDKTQLSEGQLIALKWFERNCDSFPFLKKEGLPPFKSGEQCPHLILILNPNFQSLLGLTTPEIMLDIIRTSPAENLKATPRSGEFVLYYNEKPDYSFFNAQFILQILIATKVFPNRGLWSDIFKVINPPAVQDFFLHFSKLPFFAMYNLMGTFPKKWFQPTHPHHEEMN